MKRKVIKQGHNTLTITLPSKWAEEKGIKAGDELEFIEEKNCIKLCGESDNGIAKFDLDTTKLGHFNGNFISGLYHAGFDELTIKFNDPEVYKLIQKKLKASCQGYEIIEQKKDYCIVKSVSNVIAEDFDKILRRTFLLFISLLEDMLDILQTGEYNRLDNIRYLEELNNRHTGYCKRILNKKGYVQDQKKTMFYYVILYDLEIIADDYKHIVDYIKNNNKMRISKQLISFLKEILDVYRAYYELFYKFNAINAKKVFEDGKHLFQRGILLLEKTNGKEKVVTHFMVNTVNKLYEITEPYIEMNLFNK